jgi:uncharacterized membrane protein
MAHPTLDAERTPSRVPAYVMGAMLLGSGTAHFVIPAKFDWMVPVELPGSQRIYTYGSGVAEIASGALLLVPRTRSNDHDGAQDQTERLTSRRSISAT